MSSKDITNNPGLSKICWPSLSANGALQKFIALISLGKWFWHVSRPTRSINGFDLLVFLSITEVNIYLWENFNESDQRVTLSRLAPFHSESQARPPTQVLPSSQMGINPSHNLVFKRENLILPPTPPQNHQPTAYMTSFLLASMF